MVSGPSGIYSTKPPVNCQIPTPPYRRPVPGDRPKPFVAARNGITPEPPVIFAKCKRPLKVEIPDIGSAEDGSDTEAEWPRGPKLQIELPEDESPEEFVPTTEMLKNYKLSSMDSISGDVAINLTPPNTPARRERRDSEVTIDLPMQLPEKLRGKAPTVPPRASKS